MMTQMDILLKNVMGSGLKSVNFAGVNGVNTEDSHFDALYNQEVSFLANQGGGFHPSYPWRGESQDRNREWVDGWRDRDR